MAAISFSRLRVKHWRQFRNVDLEFSPSVTILTGRNGTGKTTILNILAQHSRYHSTFLGSPSPQRDALGRFTSGAWDWEEVDRDATNLIGTITYSTSQESEIRVAKNVEVNFTPQLSPKLALSVLNIPSHRRLQGYKKIDNIPTTPITREAALNNFQKEFWSGVRGDLTRATPLTKMKEALISMAAFGEGNSRVSSIAASLSALEDFERRLHQIIPRNIGFRRIVVQIPDVILETESGRFLIDASSGGLMSLIEITWQITLFGREEERFVVVIDEPENHLHPSMQREFLPALVKAFPEAQFIVATHSPFVVSSVRDAKVYAFDVDNDKLERRPLPVDLSATSNSIITSQIDLTDRLTSAQVLRQVLGVPVTVPLWAENELDAILAKYKGRTFTAEDIDNLNSELSHRGLGDYLPDIIARASGRHASN
jgi:AAA15 family ATPase/GTPase